MCLSRSESIDIPSGNSEPYDGSVPFGGSEPVRGSAHVHGCDFDQ